MTHRRTPPAILHGNDPVFTIQDLRDGKCAVVNDGTRRQLNRVLKAAWPEDPLRATATFKYYYLLTGGKPRWYFSSGTNLPTQSVHKFLKQL